jgi:peptidyl-prolyl cis-trans isomerase D
LFERQELIMLQNLRDNSKGVVSGLLIGLLVIIFTLTGADALFNRDVSTRSVVEVNGDEITERDIANAIASQKQQMMARYGDSVPAEFLTDEYLRGPVIENLIERNLLLQTARKSGLTVSDANLNQQIFATSQFQQDGKFDGNRYQLLLRNIGHTPTTYKNVLADDSIISQLGASIVNASFVTPGETKQIMALSFQSRDFSYAILPKAKVSDNVEVSDSEIQNYYEGNPQDFTVPEQVAVDYIELNVDDLMVDINISEEEVRKQYEQNIATFVAAPERQAAHILIESGKADIVAEVGKKLAAGEDFAELAKTYSDDLGSREQGGDLGFTTGNTFPVEFEEALATISVGGVSGPVTTDAGTHFIKKLAERGTEVPTFDEERATLAEQLKRNKAERHFVDLLEKLRDLSYNAENLAEVARELDLEVQNTGLFARTGGSDIASSNLVISAAFSPDVLEQDNSSEVIELSPSRVVVLKKTEHKPSYVDSLDQVKEQIVARLRNEKTQRLLAEQAANLKSELASGKAFNDIAQAAAIEVNTVANISRSDATIDRDVLRHVFTMANPRNDVPVIDSVALANGDFALISLAQVVPGGEQISDEQKEVIANQLSAIAGQTEYDSFKTLLRNNAKISQ